MIGKVNCYDCNKYKKKHKKNEKKNQFLTFKNILGVIWFPITLLSP